jgi:uncharacterized damage-inducible protein DinB
MASPLTELFKHNLWANLRLLDACESLTDEQLDYEATGTYGSIRNTLKHLAGAEERYAARLNNQLRPASREKEAFSGFDGLRAALTRSGEALIAFVERGEFEGSILTVDPDGSSWKVQPVLYVLQAINHATEHRAHINSVRAHLGLETPELDGWGYGFTCSLITPA